MLVKLITDFRQKKYVVCVTNLLNFYLMKTCVETFLSNLVNLQKLTTESFYYDQCLFYPLYLLYCYSNFHFLLYLTVKIIPTKISCCIHHEFISLNC